MVVPHAETDAGIALGVGDGDHMNETVKNLLDFVNSPPAMPTADLASAMSEIGGRRLRVASIKLLSWLKMQRRLGKLVPLCLNDQYDWCRDLVHLVNDRQLLRDVITVEGKAVVLSAALSANDRQSILALVDAGYQPPLMTRAPLRHGEATIHIEDA
jgi:hypothetical protein